MRVSSPRAAIMACLSGSSLVRRKGNRRSLKRSSSCVQVSASALEQLRIALPKAYASVPQVVALGLSKQGAVVVLCVALQALSYALLLTLIAIYLLCIATSPSAKLLLRSIFLTF